MKKGRGWRNGAIVILLVVLLLSALALPAEAAEVEAAKDFSVDFVYRATSDAVDNLWEGEAPRRSDIKIVCKLPTPAAEQIIQVIVGQPEGEAPPEWTSTKPGIYEVKAPVGTSEENLRAENFEFSFVNVRSGDEYVWKAEEQIPGIFPVGYFELRNKKARGETLKWYEESRLGDMEGKITPKVTESIGKRLSNELHDNYAHHLDVLVVGKAGDEGTMLYLATGLAETGDKDDLGTLRAKFEEASECTDGMHELIHGEMVPTAVEMGKGEVEAAMLHDLAHKLMGSIYRTGEYLDEIEKIEDADEVKEKGGVMLEEMKKLKKLSSEAHIHSTDLATVLTAQKPLKLKDGRETVVIKHEDLTTYLSEAGGTEKGPAPIGGAVSFVIIVVGLVAVVIVRYRRR
ncbi:MAG TPA: hypothetical protein C5S37_01320 [Methanophagales archaeon]|nr:hypothetical protein [Methanophagales archaeon]